jgi:hypothetical protein
VTIARIQRDSKEHTRTRNHPIAPPDGETATAL